jgi:hypothetical protein
MEFLFRHWKKITALTAVFLILFLAYVFLPGNSGAFNSAYAKYQTIAKAQDVAVFYPSIESNEIRKELFTLLSRALIGDISDSERLETANRGIELLKLAEKEIDAMADLSPEVAARLEDIRSADSLLISQKTRSTIEEAVRLGEKRRTLIEDIRGLSYKANFYTEEIFKRIADDGGALTAAPAAFLNEQIPLVEEQFDRRSALYKELEKTAAEIEGLTGFDD